SASKLELTRKMLELIEANLRSRDFYSITANIRAESPEAVARRVTAHADVAGLRGPTIARVYSKTASDDDWFAVTVVIDGKLLLPAVDALREAGASDITVLSVKYVFEKKSWSFERLRRLL